ncbi:type II secretion system F family protein [Miniimonas sp. S16]|uniref:type II secretion system F family protein n=1 Tax=Miniimonas sp. S16 TaxID=2171623 RepID=UPI00131F1C9A|nr:type II secretion system F family protein [Miniimonas sp. S16]
MIALAAALLAVACALAVLPQPAPSTVVAAPRRRRALMLDPPLVCDLVASLLAAGASVPAALEALGEAAGEEELAVGARMLRLGADWTEAFDRVPSAWGLVLAPLSTAWEHGVDPGPSLAAAAAAWRAQRTARAREEAERLAVRLVLPLGLCLLPAFVLLGLVPVVVATGGDLLGAW